MESQITIKIYVSFWNLEYFITDSIQLLISYKINKEDLHQKTSSIEMSAFLFERRGLHKNNEVHRI
jgi:hypothetical protein